MQSQEINIGDRFVIDWKKITKLYYLKVCISPNKEFTVESFSKSLLSVYFKDNRTNKKCDCNICDQFGHNGYKCIGISDIKITRSKIAYERDRKIKQILK